MVTDIEPVEVAIKNRVINDVAGFVDIFRKTIHRDDLLQHALRYSELDFVFQWLVWS